MADIIIYSKNDCPFCVKAKEQLAKLNLSFTEKDVKDPKILDELKTRRQIIPLTVPQIFVQYPDRPSYPIGGYDDLMVLINLDLFEDILAGEFPNEH